MTDTTTSLLPDVLMAALAELDAPLPALAAVTKSLLERAALVGEFDLDWLEAQAANSPEAKSAVLNRAEPVDGALNRWRLQGGAREVVLKTLQKHGQLALRIAETPPTSDDTRRALQFLLGSEAHEGADGQPSLEALLEASSWLRGIPGINVPEPHVFRRALTRDRLKNNLAELANRFVGRADKLGLLQLFVSEAVRSDGRIPVLPLCGLGGIGKSALIARLLHDHFNNGASSRPVLFHLDFDRFGAVKTSPLELTFELTRQLASHLPNMADTLDQRRKEAQHALAGAMFGETLNASAMSVSQALEASVFVQEDLSLGLENMLGTLGREGLALLMIFDTVEALQGASVDGLEQLARWVSDLRSKIGWPDIRVVLSGRVAAMLPGPGFHRHKPIELDELSLDEATKLLVRLGVAEDAAGEIVLDLGGNPLILRLVAQLDKRGTLSLGELVSAPDRSAIIDKELIQGVLYRRILGHVRDERVRQLAHPGLAARRVTGDLIRCVIAPACLGRFVEEKEAEQLYTALRSEVWLVEPAPDGIGVLHRSDLRKLTIKLIARDPVETERVQQVHRLAVTYYEGEGSRQPHATAEAAYHRFMILGGSMLPNLDAATAAAARDGIGANIDELPRENLAALRCALDESVGDDDAASLPDYLWSRYVARRGAELVSRDAFADALELAARRHLPPAKTMWPWRLAALDALARWDDLFELLDEEFGEWETLRRLPLERDQLGRLLSWVAAGLKAARLPAAPNVGEQHDLLERLTRLGPDPVVLRLHHYLVRAGWRSSSGHQLSTSDLLHRPELAHELVQYLQVAQMHQNYRPARTQCFPDPRWLKSLSRVAGPVTSQLDHLVMELRSAAPERLVMGRYLGHLSNRFEEVWTDAFVRKAIPNEALEQMLTIRDFAEFRIPARIAILAAFTEPKRLEKLALEFGLKLPVRPFDLTEPGIRRALSNQREFVTNLVAFADRCQMLYCFLGFAVKQAVDSDQIEAVRIGIRHWLTPAEVNLFVKH